MQHLGSSPLRSWHKLPVVAVMAGTVALSLGLSACGSSDSTGDSGAPSTDSSSTTQAASDCGTVPTKAGVNDASGVLQSLGQDVVDTYAGYSMQVQASTWADWKPSKTTGFKVGFAFGPLVNSTQETLYNTVIDELKASPLVSDVVAVSATSDAVSGQIQQYQSLVSQGVDLIVYQPLQADAFVAPIGKAAEAGIPSVAINSNVDSPDSVNVLPNAYLYGAAGGAALFNQLGGEGSVLRINGVSGYPLNVDAGKGFDDAVALCPNIEVVGQVEGNYAVGTAQTATLQFLSSHPQPIAGVWEAGQMASGAVNAFTKLGRDVPPISAVGATQGFLAYWSSKAASGYEADGFVVSPRALAAATAHVAVKMLQGDGVRVSSIVFPPSEITGDNLSEWNTGSDTTSQDAATGPESLDADYEAYADKFFQK